MVRCCGPSRSDTNEWARRAQGIHHQNGNDLPFAAERQGELVLESYIEADRWVAPPCSLNHGRKGLFDIEAKSVRIK